MEGCGARRPERRTSTEKGFTGRRICTKYGSSLARDYAPCGASHESAPSGFRRCRLLARGLVRTLGDACRLAAAVAQIIELGAPHLAAAHDLHRVDHRRVDGKDALDALAVGNLADGEALLEPAAGARNADALIGLHTRAVAFLHPDVDDNGVARLELRDGLIQLLDLLGFELCNEIHVGKTPAVSRKCSRREWRARR